VGFDPERRILGAAHRACTTIHGHFLELRWIHGHSFPAFERRRDHIGAVSETCGFCRVESATHIHTPVVAVNLAARLE